MASGILILDKPSGWTSMDVCAKLRGLLGERRVGHGGTLDPMATGVLPVFVGQATKAAEFAENSRKEYAAGLRLGTVTDTQDVTGTVLETRPVTVTAEQVREALAQFTGEIQQIPPMYSAVKIQGKKLYTLARKGKDVERPARTVTIYELDLLKQESETDFRLRCTCSKGTYIRTLCHDIGTALGCGGTLYALRRTMAAGFTEADCVTLDDVKERGASLLRPLDSLFARYPAYRLPTVGKERRVRSGGAVRADLSAGLYRVYGLDGTFLCLSRAKDGELAAVKNFFGA